MGNIIDIENYLTTASDENLGELTALKKIVENSEVYVFGTGPHDDGRITVGFNRDRGPGRVTYGSRNIATGHIATVLFLSSFLHIYSK